MPMWVSGCGMVWEGGWVLTFLHLILINFTFDCLEVIPVISV